MSNHGSEDMHFILAPKSQTDMTCEQSADPGERVEMKHTSLSAPCFQN